MKPRILSAVTAVAIAIVLLVPAHAQTTQEEIQADLLGNQILAAMQAKDYYAANELFYEYIELGVVMPPPLQLQWAVNHFRRAEHYWGEILLQLYLQRAERGTDDYQLAIKLLAEMAPKAAAERAETGTCRSAGGDSLHEAAFNGDCQRVKRLLQQGADVNAKIDFEIPFSSGKSTYKVAPFRLAMFSSFFTADMLIEHGADVNTLAVRKEDGFSETPLHNSAWSDRYWVTAFLIARGADVNAKSSDGYTPLDNALRNKKKKTAALLRQQGGRRR